MIFNGFCVSMLYKLERTRVACRVLKCNILQNMAQLLDRVSHPSTAQSEALLAFLERRPNLAKGFLRTKSAKERANSEWVQIAIQLNSIGGGAVKTPQKWMKYWNDKKNAVKKKAAARAGTRTRTGGGAAQYDEVVELSHIEERILTLMGGQSFATGDTHLRIDPFSSSHVNTQEQSVADAVGQPVLMDHNQGTEHESPSLLNAGDTTHMQTPIIQRSDDTYCPSDYCISPIILPDGEARQATQAKTTDMSPFVMAPSYDSPVAGPSRQPDLPLRDNITTPLPMPTRHSPIVMEQPLLSTVSTPRRRRRRLLQRNNRSPPTQRRSIFMSMVEKFMNIECRKEERLAERDRQLLDSMKSIENKMQAMVDILKDLFTR